jgi:hypothetical protein
MRRLAKIGIAHTVQWIWTNVLFDALAVTRGLPVVLGGAQVPKLTIGASPWGLRRLIRGKAGALGAASVPIVEGGGKWIQTR